MAIARFARNDKPVQWGERSELRAGATPGSSSVFSDARFHAAYAAGMQTAHGR
jgi:hypothetical protein